VNPVPLEGGLNDLLDPEWWWAPCNYPVVF